MEQIRKLPIDIDTWKMLGYSELYYIPNPLDVVANSTIKFYENRLTELNLSDEDRDNLKDSIYTIKNLIR